MPLAKLSLRKLSIFTGGQRFSTGSQRFSTGGPPTAIEGLLNNLLLTFPTGGQVLTIHGHRGFVGIAMAIGETPWSISTQYWLPRNSLGARDNLLMDVLGVY